jgi:chromosome segregation ATPase
VEPAADPRRQLGQIMVDEGLLTESQLLDALAEHNRTGTPLGKVLVDLGFVSPGAVANALAEQHGGLLRTEYGTSAGLREMAGRAPIRTDAQPTLPVAAAAPPPTPLPAAPPTPAPALGSGLRLAGAVAEAPADAPPPPAPLSPEPAAAVALEPHVAPEPADVVAPEPEPAPFSEAAPAPQVDTARIDELESKLHAVLTERNSLAQSFNELQARLSEAAQAHEAGVAAEVRERMGALESQLQSAAAQREELERAHQQAAERVGELEARLNEDADGRHELDNEVERLRSEAADRDAAFEQLSAMQAELEELRSRPAEDTSGQLDELARQRAAAEERARALEHDLAQLREQAESLRVEVDVVREQVPADDALAEKVSALEQALQALTAERDAAVAHSTELEPQLAQLREQAARQDDGLAEKISGLEEAIQALTAERDHALARLRDAATPFAGSTAEVEELRRQLAARDRGLAESVGEIAKMSREHRALLQLVERQLQLEETTTSLPEPKSEAAHVLFVPAASGYTLVEREGVAPEAGDLVDLDGGRYVVRRHGPSPLPGPRRRCAYLERA